MRPFAYVGLLLPLVAAAEPRLGTTTTLEFIDATFCKSCRLAAHVGVVEVYEDRDGPNIRRIAIVIPAAGKRTGAVIADFSAGGHDFLTHETAHVQTYEDGGHHDVGLLLDLDHESAPAGTRMATTPWRTQLALACGTELADEGTLLWTCRSLEVPDGCVVDKWHPPAIDFKCRGSQQLSAR